MVQGINHFVPHAFLPKAYPDPDCFPHFYAGGHNPQYKAFGQVILYMNRICNLIFDGKAVCHTAVLYQAEQEWMGECMLNQKILRTLMENQITAHIIPEDVFDDNNYYKEIYISSSKYITETLAKNIIEMTNHGIHVYFVDGYPQAIIGDDVQGVLEQVTSNCECISLSHVSKHACKDIVLETHNHGIRVFHYKADEEILYFVNESRDSFQSQVMIDGEMDLVGYDAWNNKLITVPYHKEGGKTIFTLSLNSCQSIILI